ncbi:hypothetical protein QYM36_019535 [Artemia franciscana]|nr:hypothetical protein QYM36_019535 [Artemia franciscana]
MKQICADCGVDFRDMINKGLMHPPAVAMVHNIPELMITMEEAERIGKEEQRNLLKHRKLVLLLDLDLTLIHTTNDENINPNMKDVFHFRLGPSNQLRSSYHTRKRPHLMEFLEEMSKIFELHIVTFGTRTYAHEIARQLDPTGRFFSKRILSRDECFNQHTKSANLKALFPCGDNFVCIVDDREEVWNFAPNLIHVKPYHFFQRTGDIHAPPGLEKKELDSPNEKPKREQGKEKNVTKEKTADSIRVPIVDRGVEEKSGGKMEEGLDKENKNSDIKKEFENTENDSSPIEDNVLTDKSLESENEQKKDDQTNERNMPVQFDYSAEDPSDSDDYLIYLQDILKSIHKTFYEMYDDFLKKGDKKLPDLKTVIPYVRSKVLAGVNIVFSHVIPNTEVLEKSRPFLVARSLGANVTKDIVPRRPSQKGDATTHVIAPILGTAKVKKAQQLKYIKLVTPDWLWACAERWEHVVEGLFPVTETQASNKYRPPSHCVTSQIARQEAETSRSLKNLEAEKPPVPFTQEMLDEMSEEVESTLDEEEDKESLFAGDEEFLGDEEEEEYDPDATWIKTMENFNELEDESEFGPTGDVYEEDHPHGYKAGLHHSPDGHFEEAEDTSDEEETARKRKRDPYEEDDDDTVSQRFRRGEDLPDMFEFEQPDREYDENSDCEGNIEFF